MLSPHRSLAITLLVTSLLLAIGCTADVAGQDVLTADNGRAQIFSQEDVSLELSHIVLLRDGKRPVPIRPNRPSIDEVVRTLTHYWCEGLGKDRETAPLQGFTVTRPLNLSCGRDGFEVVDKYIGDEGLPDYDWVNFQSIGDFQDGRWRIDGRSWLGYPGESFAGRDGYLAHLVIRYY